MKFPLLSILALIFVTLKLTGTIDWSWFWVLSPIWAQIILFILVLFTVAWAKSR